MSPSVSTRVLGICRVAVGGVWLYQGLLPKLLGPHHDELAMAAAAGMPAHMQAASSYAAGAAEIVLGLCVLLLPRRLWPYVASAASMLLLLGFVAVFAPTYLVGAFNPVVMNLTSLALSLIAIIVLRDPSAERR